MCWQTVEQQSIPALAIASADMDRKRYLFGPRDGTSCAGFVVAVRVKCDGNQAGSNAGRQETGTKGSCAIY